MFGNAVFARAKQAIAFSLFKKFFERNTTAKSKNSIIMLLPTRSAKIACAENLDQNLLDKDIPAVSRKSCERLIHLTVEAVDRLHIDKAIS